MNLWVVDNIEVLQGLGIVAIRFDMDMSEACTSEPFLTSLCRTRAICVEVREEQKNG
jgi:hypothetical protein